MGRAMLGKSLIHLSVDGWGCVLSLLFTWDQTMVEVMKIMATSFKRSHARTATLSAPNPAASCRRPMPPLETPGHSRASLGLSFVGSLLLSPGSWCTQSVVCALQASVSPVLCKLWWFYGRVNGNLLQEIYAIPRSAGPRAPALADPYLHRRHSDTVLVQSLWVGHSSCALPRSEKLR